MHQIVVQTFVRLHRERPFGKAKPGPIRPHGPQWCGDLLRRPNLRPRPNGAPSASTSSTRRSPSCPSRASTGRRCATWPRPPASTSPRSTTTSPRSGTCWSPCSRNAGSSGACRPPRSPRCSRTRPLALADLLDDILQSMLEVEDFVRLMLGEVMRGDETAYAVGVDLFAATQKSLEQWLAEREPTVGPPGGQAALARMLRTLLVGLLARARHRRARSGRRWRRRRRDRVPRRGPRRSRRSSSRWSGRSGAHT